MPNKFVCVSSECLLVCGPEAVNLQVMGLETHRVLITWWLVAVLLWSVCSFRMTDASNVANDNPPVVDRVVETRSGQGPLRWALQAHPSTSCTRRHIIGVQSFCPSTVVFLWDAIFDTTSMPCCMLAVGMCVYVRVCVCACMYMRVCVLVHACTHTPILKVSITTHVK